MAQIVEHGGRLRQSARIVGGANAAISHRAAQHAEGDASRLVGHHVRLQLASGPDIVKNELDHDHVRAVGREANEVGHLSFFYRI